MSLGKKSESKSITEGWYWELWITSEFLPPAKEVCEGYVFTGVCLSTGGACMVAWGAHMVASGGCAWLLGGVYVVAPGGHAWLLGGCAWLLWGGMRGCSQGGVHGCSRGEGMRGCSRGACMVAPRGGVHGCSRGGVCGCLGGHAWLLPGGACMVAPGGHAWFLRGGACVVFSMRYGQWAGGTYPTGMHSCFCYV